MPFLAKPWRETGEFVQIGFEHPRVDREMGCGSSNIPPGPTYGLSDLRNCGNPEISLTRGAKRPGLNRLGADAVAAGSVGCRGGGRPHAL